MQWKTGFHLSLSFIFLIFLTLFISGSVQSVFAEEEPSFELPANISRAIGECLAEMNSGEPESIQKGEQRLQNICNVLSGPDYESPRMDAEKQIVAVLNHSDNRTSRPWLIRMLGRIGSAECVEEIQKLLKSSERTLFDEVIAALSQIPDPKAGDALRDFLAQTNDLSKKVAIVNALGFREEPKSVQPLFETVESLERALALDEIQLSMLSSRLDTSSPHIKILFQRRELSTLATLALGQIGTTEAAEHLQRFRFAATPTRKAYFGPALVACASKMSQKGENREALSIYHFLQRGFEDISGVQIACANGILQIASSSENLQYFLFLLERAVYDRNLLDICARFLWETQGNTARHILPEDEETQKAIMLLNQYEREQRLNSYRSSMDDSSNSEDQDSSSDEANDANEKDTEKKESEKKPVSKKITEEEALKAENLLKQKRLERFFKFPVEFQALILRILGERQDESLLPFVQKALESSDQNVQAAAMEALAFIGNDDSVSFLLKRLSNEIDIANIANKEDTKNTETASLLQRRIVYALKRTTLFEADQKIADAIQNASTAQQKNPLLEIAAARHLSLYYPLFRNAMNSDDSSTRQIAALGISSLSQGNDLFLFLEMLSQSDDGKKRNDIESVIVQILENQNDKEYHIDSILKFYEKTDPKRRFALLGLLGRVAGKKAFETVLTAMRSGDASAKEAAFETLCRWPDANAFDELYRLSTKLVNKERAEKAIKGYVRLLTTTGNRTVQESLFLIQKALDQAQDQETKEEIFLRAASLKSEETLDFLFPYLQQPQTRNFASEAILKLAEDHSFRSAYRNRVDPLLNGIMRTADSREMSERAWNLLKQTVLSTKH